MKEKVITIVYRDNPKTKRFSIERTNKGLNGVELLGIIELVRADVLRELGESRSSLKEQIDKRIEGLKNGE